MLRFSGFHVASTPFWRIVLGYHKNIKINPYFFIDIMAIISSGPEEKAVLVSPWYNRSTEGFGKCLQFRYLMFGPGAKTLKIFQELEMGPRQIWKDFNNNVPFWRYGQVSLTSVARHKVRAGHCKTVVLPSRF